MQNALIRLHTLNDQSKIIGLQITALIAAKADSVPLITQENYNFIRDAIHALGGDADQPFANAVGDPATADEMAALLSYIQTNNYAGQADIYNAVIGVVNANGNFLTSDHINAVSNVINMEPSLTSLKDLSAQPELIGDQIAALNTANPNTIPLLPEVDYNAIRIALGEPDSIAELTAGNPAAPEEMAILLNHARTNDVSANAAAFAAHGLSADNITAANAAVVSAEAIRSSLTSLKDLSAQPELIGDQIAALNTAKPNTIPLLPEVDYNAIRIALGEPDSIAELNAGNPATPEEMAILLNHARTNDVSANAAAFAAHGLSADNITAVADNITAVAAQLFVTNITKRVAPPISKITAKAITPAQIEAIDPANFPKFLKNLGDNLKHLTLDAVKAIKAEQIEKLGSKDFIKLISETHETTHLSGEAHKAIRADQIKDIGKNMFHTLRGDSSNLNLAVLLLIIDQANKHRFNDKEAGGNVHKKICTSINSEHIKKISSKEFNKIITGKLQSNLHFLRQGTVESITPEQLNGIKKSDDKTNFLIALQDKIAHLSKVDLLYDKDVAGGLSSDNAKPAVQAITAEQIKKIPSEEFGVFIKNLGKNLGELSETAIAAIKSAQLKAINVDSEKKLFIDAIGKKIAKFDESCLPALTNILSSKGLVLSDSTTSNLTSAQIDALFADGVDSDRKQQFIQNIGGNISKLNAPSSIAKASFELSKSIQGLRSAGTIVRVDGIPRLKLRKGTTTNEIKTIIDGFGANLVELEKDNSWHNRVFANFLVQPDVNLRDTASVQSIKSIQPSQIALIAPNQFNVFIENIGDNFKKLSEDAIGAITAQQASTLKLDDLDKIKALSNNDFETIVTKKVQHELALSGLRSDVEVTQNGEDEDLVSISFKTKEEAQKFASVIMGKPLAAKDTVVEMPKSLLKENLKPALESDRRKLKYKDLELKVSQQDRKRSYLGTALRIPTTPIALGLLAVGSVAATAHNNLGLKHIPVVGSSLNLATNILLTGAGSLSAGWGVGIARNLKQSVNIEQKKAQTSDNKGWFMSGLATANKWGSALPGSIAQTIRIPLKATGDFLQWGDRVETTNRNVKFNNKQGFDKYAEYLQLSRIITFPLRAVGAVLSGTADALDTQSVGRGNAVRRIDDGLNRAFRQGTDIVDEKNPNLAMKQSPNLGAKRLLGCSDELLERKNPKFETFKEGKFLGTQEFGLSNGMKAVKYDGWDQLGNIKTIFKIVNPEGVHFDLKSTSLSKDLRTITEKDMRDALQDERFSVIKSNGKDTGISIGEFKELLSNGGEKDKLIAQLKESSNLTKDTKDAEVVVSGYTIKFDTENNISFFKGNIGGIQERVLASEKDFDSVLFGVVNQVMEKSIKKSNSNMVPSTKVINASAERLGEFGLYR